MTMNERKDDTTKDSITLVTDKNQPNLRLPDTEIGESLKRLCRNDDIKKALYEATKNHKKMKRKPWVDHVIHGTITIVGITVTAIFTAAQVAPALSSTPTP